MRKALTLHLAWVATRALTLHLAWVATQALTLHGTWVAKHPVTLCCTWIANDSSTVCFCSANTLPAFDTATHKWYCPAGNTQETDEN